MTVLKISGLPLTTASFEEDDIDKQITDRLFNHHIYTTNTVSGYYALRMESHKQYVLNADYSCCKGKHAEIEGVFGDERVPRRNAPAFMKKVSEYGIS